jgi:hypothetical protein
MKRLLTVFFISLSILFFACQKEFSFELSGTAAQGSLQEDGGGLCLPKTVTGVYVAGTTLNPANNTITVDVNVVSAGSYRIYSDTINGYYFSATGSFTGTGTQQVTLKGSGTPIAQGNNLFTIFFDSTDCDVTVQVLPAGSGGPATFTLAGAGGSCTTPTIAGDYVIGTALNASNTVTLTVNVTAIGTYNITTTAVQGMTFTGTGTLTATGSQTITLVGSGTPVAPAGNVTVPVTAGGGTCNFVINLLATPPPMDYFPRTINSNWSYEWNDNALDSVLKRVFPNTLTALGNSYNIFMPNEGAGFDSTGNYPAGYYRKNANDYFEWFDFGGWVGYDNPLWVEYTMLKDNLAAGSPAWKSPATGGFAGTVSMTPLNLRLSYRILQKDVPVSITSSTGVVNYQNVIVVEERFEIELTPGVWTDATAGIDYYGKSYYARGIGLILFEAFDAANARTDWMELRRHQVF